MTTRVDRTSPLSLHHQLHQVLLDRIKRGELQPGSRLPTEAELGEQYGVSRITVRQAVGELARQGWVYRVQGSGTYVTHKVFPQNLHHLTSFTEDMRAYGKAPTSRLLALDVTTPPADVAAALKHDGPVTRIERVRLDEGRPIEVQTSYLPTKYPIDPERFEDTTSLYELLTREYGVHLHAADETLEAVRVDERDAQLLGLQAGEPILRVERVTHDEHGEPVEFVIRRYRTDEYKYYVRLTRPANP